MSRKPSLKESGAEAKTVTVEKRDAGIAWGAVLCPVSVTHI